MASVWGGRLAVSAMGLMRPQPCGGETPKIGQAPALYPPHWAGGKVGQLDVSALGLMRRPWPCGGEKQKSGQAVSALELMRPQPYGGEQVKQKQSDSKRLLAACKLGLSMMGKMKKGVIPKIGPKGGKPGRSSSSSSTTTAKRRKHASQGGGKVVRKSIIDETPEAKWDRLRGKWQKHFLVKAGQPQLGSWIDDHVTADSCGRRIVKLGCKCCSFAKVQVGAFPKYDVGTVTAMQAINFQKHEGSRHHVAAVQSFLEGTIDVSMNAPSEQEFSDLCDRILAGRGTCSTPKDVAMTYCVSEGILSVSQGRVEQAESIALFRDERIARLAIRFRAVSKDLDVHSGVLGQERDYGTGARNLTLATGRVMKRFCSRFHGPPGKAKRRGFVKKKLFKHLRYAVTTITTDSAADEMLCAEMMRSSSLSAMRRRLTPKLKFVIRDRAHGSKRLVSRGWGADSYLNNVTQMLVRSRKSIARLIHFSPAIRERFGHYARGTFRVVRKVVKNMRAAPQRYECLQKPFGRSILYMHANIKTALWVATTREDESSNTAKDWLEWIDTEACVQGSMMADASDQVMILTRFLDDESTDPATVPGEVNTCLTTLDVLFGEERKCLEVFGYTKAMMQILSKPMVWTVRGKVRTLGSEKGVPEEIIQRCLDRLSCWRSLLRATIAVEFPSFEVSHVGPLNYCKRCGRPWQTLGRLVAAARR